MLRNCFVKFVTKLGFCLSCLGLVFFLTACPFLGGDDESAVSADGQPGREVYFIGVDISGSFKATGYFKDSIRFLAHYTYMHINGLGGTKVPAAFFVGSIGGVKPDEPKTFYPIQTFEHQSIKQIEAKLFNIFPKTDNNKYTDYDAFFEQVGVFVRSKKLVLKPISLIMLTDGIPDAPKKDGKHDYRTIKLQSLETLARDITLRVLYTSAVVGMDWRTQVPRKRVKVWSQDAEVMKAWKAKHIFEPGKKFKDKKRFFSWMLDNVDFRVSAKRVD